MRQPLRAGLLALLALASIDTAKAQPAQGTGPTTRPATQPAVPAIYKQVLATVNGQAITRGDILGFLSQYPASPGNEKEMYEQAVDYIANHLLITQFLASRRIEVTDKDLAEEFAKSEREVKANLNRELKTLLAERGITMEAWREQVKPIIAWKKLVDQVAKDDVLEKFVASNQDVFSRTQVKASHILVLVKPDATPAEKDAARQKLSAIKQQIEARQISFADAANKYSEDEQNKQVPKGGDLGYFQRKGQFIESFAAKAFAMKPGAISDPIETEFGFHLIEVTDRIPGKPFDFKQNRLSVLNAYGADLQERVIDQQRKTAKIEVKPMPADLFPPAIAPTTPAGAATKPASPPR